MSAWSVAAFALGAYCFWLAIAAWVVTRWELFSDDDTVAGMINTVFGRLESGVVLRRMITRRVTAGPITSIDVLNAGLDEVAEHTRGRISADSALLLACLMGLVSSGAASLVVADTHGWTKPHPWSRTRRSSPIQTLLLSRNDVEPASLPVLEQRCLVALSSLERTMAPQRRFELSNVVRVLAHMSVEPSRPPPGDDRNASQIARALVQFFEHIGGDALGLEDVPSELRMTAVHLSALVTRERAPCATALAP